MALLCVTVNNLICLLSYSSKWCDHVNRVHLQFTIFKYLMFVFFHFHLLQLNSAMNIGTHDMNVQLTRNRVSVCATGGWALWHDGRIKRNANWKIPVSAHLSDLRHIGGTLTLGLLQLRLQVLFVSSQLQSRTEVQGCTWVRRVL